MSRFVSIDLIDRSPWADLFPHDEEHVERLRADIEKRGITTPLHVYPRSDRYELLAGHDRLEAAKRAGLNEVPVDRRPVADEDARFSYFVKDNTLRKDVDKRAIAKAVWLRYPEATVRDVADVAGVSYGTAHAAREDAGVLNINADIENERGQVRPRTYQPRTFEPSTNGDSPEPQSQEQEAPVKATEAAAPTVEDVVREGMAMEAGGAPSSEVADALEIGEASYRKARYIVMLSDLDALTDSERERVTEALWHLNEHRAYSDAFKRVEDVVDRVFGETRKIAPDRLLANRMAAFDRAFGTLIQACSMAPNIDIPALTPERLERVTTELREAADNVHRLRRTIEEAHK